MSADFVAPIHGRPARDAKRRLVKEVRALPGVDAVGLSRWALFSGSSWDGDVGVAVDVRSGSPAVGIVIVRSILPGDRQVPHPHPPRQLTAGGPETADPRSPP